jgi:hypothetical protein
VLACDAGFFEDAFDNMDTCHILLPTAPVFWLTFPLAKFFLVNQKLSLLSLHQFFLKIYLSRKAEGYGPKTP